nr:MAG TPA: RimK-related lysine biosynthesis protein, Probable-dependent amine/thiol ligase family Amino-group [Caudoviricetes sp.]
MAEYVKCDDVHRALEQINPVDYGAMWDYEAHYYAGECLRDCKEAIDSIHATDVAPVVHGRWIHNRYEDCSEQFELVKCSQCNHEAYAMAFYVRGGNYCPSCGARMDGGDSDAAD